MYDIYLYLNKHSIEHLCVSLLVEDYEIIICTSNKWYAATGATVYLDLKGDGLDTSGEFIAGKSFDGDRYYLLY